MWMRPSKTNQYVNHVLVQIHHIIPFFKKYLQIFLSLMPIIFEICKFVSIWSTQ